MLPPKSDVLSCSCSSLKPLAEASTIEAYGQANNLTLNLPISQNGQDPYFEGFPFTTQRSIDACCSAAIRMSKLFQSLPLQIRRNSDHQQRPKNEQELPRTIPFFACCLMQSSYALSMLIYNARVATGYMTGSADELHPSTPLIKELQTCLERIITVTWSYSQSSKALIGMRGMHSHGCL